MVPFGTKGKIISTEAKNNGYFCIRILWENVDFFEDVYKEFPTYTQGRMKDDVEKNGWRINKGAFQMFVKILE